MLSPTRSRAPQPPMADFYALSTGASIEQLSWHARCASPGFAFRRRALHGIAPATCLILLLAGTPAPARVRGFSLAAVKSLRVQTPQDNQGEQARALYAEGRGLQEQGTREALQQALKKYQAALALWRTMQDKAGESITLDALGVTSYALQEYQQAVQYHQQAVEVYRGLKDRPEERYSLYGLGTAYYSLGRYDDAIRAFEQSLSVQRKFNEPEDVDTLILLGVAYDGLTRYEKSIEYYKRALEVRRAQGGGAQAEPGHRAQEGVILSNLGLTYTYLGRYETAIEYYKRALEIFSALKDRASRVNEERTLNNIGLAHYNLKQYEVSLDYYQKALMSQSDVQDQQGYTLINVCAANHALGRYEVARRACEQSLALHVRSKSRLGEALALVALGKVYRSRGQYALAVEKFGAALGITREVGARAREANALNELMIALNALGKPRLAILYGKQAVNVYQEIRANIKQLDKETQRAFLDAKQDTYHLLTELLINEGRLPEAQQVLGLLKEKEYFEFVRGDAATASALKRADLSPDETKALQRYDAKAAELSRIASEFTSLREKGTPPTDARYMELEADLEAANRAFQVLLRQLADEFGKEGEKSKATVKELQENKGLQSDLEEWGGNTAALHTIVGEENYHVILTTPAYQRAYEADPKIKGAELNRLVLDFREAVQNPEADPRLLGKKLYDILLKPVVKDLEASGVTTLVWSLDGTLRYLPLAALHDGKQYVAERYRNVIITLASRTRLNAASGGAWRALGLGVSKAVTTKEGIAFNELPAVKEELRSIVRQEGQSQEALGILPGAVFLDEEFTETAMKNSLGRYPVVHIASHFSFKPGNETDSFLLLGDGSRLTLDRIRVSASPMFRKVELLTLSACDTATGGEANGKEVEGFAVLAQQQGAQAVLATLWPVYDESTGVLMQHFYKQREVKAGTTKAEALQQAQLSLLRGQPAGLRGNESTRSRRVSGLGKTNVAPPFTPDPKAPYAHPYFWAPFILIGNWR